MISLCKQTERPNFEDIKVDLELIIESEPLADYQFKKTGLIPTTTVQSPFSEGNGA